jgi:plasmid replication initiation protein
MNLKNLTVCKSNEVIEAGYKLSLNEQRVILACIAQVNSAEELLKTDEFELSAKDFAALFGISEDRAYSELQEVAKNLYQRSLTIYNPDPTRPKLTKLETRWVSSIGYIPEESRITLCFAQKILPYLSELKGQFTRYELKHVGNMTSIYGIRLYELLMQWKTTGKREIEIDWLKKQLQLDENYSRMDNFKARVITPAIKDINTHSNYEVSWTQRKTGRKVTHLTFEFSEKKPVVPLRKTRAKTKTLKQPTTEVNEIKIDNLEYFADMRKKYKGKFNEKSVPQDIVEKLKAQGRW